MINIIIFFLFKISLFSYFRQIDPAIPMRLKIISETCILKMCFMSSKF